MKVHDVMNSLDKDDNNVDISGEKQIILDNRMKKLINIDVLQKLIVKWIVECRYTFTKIKSLKLYKIFEYLDSKSTKTLHTANILQTDYLKYLQNIKFIIIELFITWSRIHLFFDFESLQIIRQW